MIWMASSKAYAVTTKRGQMFALLSGASVDSDSNVGLMQCAVEGKWTGHAKAGSFALTGEMFDEMISRFDEAGGEMMVDWNHAALSGDQSPQAGEAAGWIKSLEKRVVDGIAQLWALVEWTDEAAAKIRSKKYKFCSPSIALDEKGNLIGKLINVALTNLPFLKGMSPIMLSEMEAEMAEDVAPEETAEKPAELPAKMSALEMLAEKAGKTAAEMDAWMSENIDKIMALIGDLAEQSSGGAMQASAIDRDMLVTLSAQVSGLIQKDKQRERAAVSAEVAGYIRDGRIDVAHKDLAIATFSSNRALAERTYLRGAKVVPIGESQAARSKDPPVTSTLDLSVLSPSQKVAFGRLRHGDFYTEQKAFDYVTKHVS